MPRQFIRAGRWCALGLAAERGFPGVATRGSVLGIPLGCAFHGTIESLGSIWWGRVRPPGLSCDGKDPILRHPQMIYPSLHVLSC